MDSKKQRVFSTSEDNSMSHYIDFLNIKFPNITVIRKMPIIKGSSHAFWEYKCICGKVKVASSHNLRRNKNISCGCSRVKRKGIKDIIGLRVGKLVVIKNLESRNRYGVSLFDCLCDCGQTKIVDRGSLTNKSTTSCGCNSPYKNDKSAQRVRKIWKGMIDRCYNPLRNSYVDYGLKGITICNDWLNDFNSFYVWSISNGYSDGLTIDRFPNVKGNYEPSNCRWANVFQQANNRTNNVCLTYNGETKTISEWSSIVGINQSCISQRLRKLKWSVKDALTIKTKTNGVK